MNRYAAPFPKLRALLLVCLLILMACARPPVKPPSLLNDDYGYLKQYITWLAQEEMKKHKITGLSIALVDDQRVVWAEGFGYADRAADVPATPATIYRVGSVSKLFTATAALQFVEAGRLDIDKPLQTYLPGFSIKSRFPGAGPITPRTLMTHHSGVPSDLAKGMWTRHPEPFAALVKQLGDEYAALPPNTAYSYSNVGVTLLGAALEGLAGRDFASHMDAAVLHPLGMLHSSFSPGIDRSALASKAYKSSGEAEEASIRDVPAGGLNSNVVDLARFMEMIFAGGKAGEGRILRPETVAGMLSPQNADVSLDLDFRTGLAWALGGLGDIDPALTGPVAHHSGANLYHRSMLIILPDHKLGVVVLSNSSSAGGVVGEVATETLKLALETRTGIRQPERKKSETAGAASRDVLQGYEGSYATMAGVIPVTRKSDHLRAEVMGRSFRLVPRADGWLRLQYRLFGLIPISLGGLDDVAISRAIVAGRDILKARSDGREMLLGERIEPVPIPDKWLGRTGAYDIANLGDDTVLFQKLRLRQDGHLLVVDYTMPHFFAATRTLALKPLSDNEAILYGLGRGMGETIEAVTVDGREYLKYSGYLLLKKQ